MGDELSAISQSAGAEEKDGTGFLICRPRAYGPPFFQDQTTTKYDGQNDRSRTGRDDLHRPDRHRPTSRDIRKGSGQGQSPGRKTLIVKRICPFLFRLDIIQDLHLRFFALLQLHSNRYQCSSLYSGSMFFRLLSGQNRDPGQYRWNRE